MPNHLSPLGIVHTAISILAILAALFALIKYGKINPAQAAGKAYIWLTVITCITGLPIMKTGHLTPGHYLGIIILVLLPIAIYAKSIRLPGKSAAYIQTILFSLTVFFSFIPATVETLTRLPVDHPLAAGPGDPLIKTVLLVLFILFLAGVTWQLIQIKAKGKTEKAVVSEANS